MRPSLLALLFPLGFLLPSSAAQTRSDLGEVKTVTIPGTPTTPLNTATPPTKLDLSISSLDTAALVPTPLPQAPAPGLGQVPVLTRTEVPSGVLKPEAPARDSQPKAQEPDVAESDVLSGRALFDLAAPKNESRTSIRERIASWFKKPDLVPEWPGKAGETVRLNGRAWTLGKPLGEGGGSNVWLSKELPEVAIKIIHPEYASMSHYGAEAQALEALARTKVSHARLLAASPDGKVIVKDYVEGDSAKDLLERGPLSESQKAGLSELVSQLVRIAYTADLVASNLLWDRWRGRWTLVDAGGFAQARPSDPILRILQHDIARRGGLDSLEFLSALRARLGQDSEAWRKVLADEKESPALRRFLQALARQDSKRPPAPKLEFSAAAHHPVLTDTMVPRSKFAKTLGYDPQTLTKVKLLPSQRNPAKTYQVWKIEPPNGSPRVLKVADKERIRRELAVRALIHRYFANHLRAPRAVGYDGGWESGLVMEHVEGGPDWLGRSLTLEQRVALFLLAQTFGLYDLNPDGVLVDRQGRPWLIDFDQGFGRREAVTGRFPDETIVEEMPWVSRAERNAPEDYFPAIRAWRELYLKPETQGEVRNILLASGYQGQEAEALLAVFRANLRDMEPALQADVEFANFFVRKNSPHP